MKNQLWERRHRALALLGLLLGAALAPVVTTLAQGATPAPELRAGPWINGRPQRLKALKGKVVALEFWAYG